MWRVWIRRVARGVDGDWSGTDWLSHDSWLVSHDCHWPGHDILTGSDGEVLEERLEGVAESVGIELGNASSFWLLSVLVVPVPSVLTVVVTMLSSFVVLVLLSLLQEGAILLL